MAVGQALKNGLGTSQGALGLGRLRLFGVKQAEVKVCLRQLMLIVGNLVVAFRQTLMGRPGLVKSLLGIGELLLLGVQRGKVVVRRSQVLLVTRDIRIGLRESLKYSQRMTKGLPGFFRFTRAKYRCQVTVR